MASPEPMVGSHCPSHPADPSLASKCLQQNCWKSWCVEVDNRSITRSMRSGAGAAAAASFSDNAASKLPASFLEMTQPLHLQGSGESVTLWVGLSETFGGNA